MDLLSILVILLVILMLGTLAMVFTLWRKLQEQSSGGPAPDSLLLLQNQLQDLSRSLDTKLGEGTDRMFEGMRTQSEQVERLMANITRQVSDQLLEVTKGVTETKESTKQVFTLAEQLQNLEKVLTHQKQRGNLGERSLELILSNILPPGAFKMQHEFPGGETVDAVIMTKEGIIPVDAKFSLDNYNRVINAIDEAQREDLEKAFKNDLKARIDETSKYIRPKDGTLPFAFMYIPAEAIYYDLLVNEVGAVKVNTRNLIDYAYNEKKVIIVSPTTLAAYLQTVLFGFKAFQIEQRAKDIAKNVEALGRHINAYQEFYKKLGTSLSTTVNHWNAGSKELSKIEKDVLRIDESVEIAIDLPALDRPLLEGKD